MRKPHFIGSNAINSLDRDPHGRAVDLDGSSQRATHDRWPKAESGKQSMANPPRVAAAPAWSLLTLEVR